VVHRAALAVSATLAFSHAACQPNQALGLRVDPPATGARADAPLRGVRVAIGAVRDLRAVGAADDNDGWFGGLLGCHRDGLLQVRPFECLATEPVEQSVAADLRVALVARSTT